MEHVYGWGPGLGPGGGNHQLSREEWSLGRGALPGACMWLGVGSFPFFTSHASCFTLLKISLFGQTVAFQSLRNKSLPNHVINTVGTCTYLYLRETVAPPGGVESFQVQVQNSEALTKSISWEPSLPMLETCLRPIRLNYRKR